MKKIIKLTLMMSMIVFGACAENSKLDGRLASDFLSKVKNKKITIYMPAKQVATGNLADGMNGTFSEDGKTLTFATADGPSKNPTTMTFSSAVSETKGIYEDQDANDKIGFMGIIYAVGKNQSKVFVSDKKEGIFDNPTEEMSATIE